MLVALAIMTVLSILSYTQFGTAIATIGAVTIIGIPIAFALYVLPTVTLALWICFLSYKALGSWIYGALAIAALLAANYYILGPMVDSKAQALTANDSQEQLPEIEPKGIIAISSRNNVLGDKPLQLLLMGFDGVLFLPPVPDFIGERADKTTGVVVTLKRTEGALCTVLQDQVTANETRGRRFLLSVKKRELEQCISVRDATREDSYIAETVERSQVEISTFGKPAQISRVFYHRHDQQGRVEVSRTTWVTYSRPGIPLISRMVSDDGISVSFRPGLEVSRTRLRPSEKQPTSGGYVLTNVDKSFGK